MDPLVFEPWFRPQVWGDRRLERRLGKRLPPTGRFGESWEISAHPLHVSRVAEGPLQGRTLGELWADRASELVAPKGTASNKGTVPFSSNENWDSPPPRFPWLLKLLDCHDLLSVQVHPDDRIAEELAPGESGKTEAWVVIEAEPKARIYAGLLPGVARADLERHLQAGTVAECLHSFTPQPGDCIFFPAGTVHSVGWGVLMAEVQQSSDATFRLFDWNRLGADGKPRPLHQREALLSIDWAAGPVQPAAGQPIGGLPSGVRGERLVECRHFVLDRFHLDRALEIPLAGQLSIWALLDGSAELRGGSGGYRRIFRRGETVLVPAAAKSFHWTPIAGSELPTLLAVHLP